jgi:hypothetical protein
VIKIMSWCGILPFPIGSHGLYPPPIPPPLYLCSLDKVTQTQRHLLHPEDGGSMAVRNVSILTHHFTVSQPGRPGHIILIYNLPK